MSYEYDLRFKEVVLDLSKREDIYSWLTSIVEIDEDVEVMEPDGMIEGSRCLYLNPEEDTIRYINVDDIKNVMVNVITSNKNKDSDMENLVYLLLPYVKSGSIFYYNDLLDKYFELNLEKMLLSEDKEDFIYKKKLTHNEFWNEIN